MRHRVAGNKLGRTTSHRAAMTRNMANSLIEHERIVTTLPKAKEVKPFVEKLVTLSKEVVARITAAEPSRRCAARTRVEKLFDILGPRFQARPGGYCRIVKLAKTRLGDNGAACDPRVRRAHAQGRAARPPTE